jgi:uncharacterized membrane protein (DUF485 family)
MTADPAVIAARLARQRARLHRVLRVSVPTTLIGFPLVIAFDQPALRGIADRAKVVVSIIAVVGFLTTWVCLLAYWVNRLRDMRNMFRPGSARAYEDR